MRRRFQSHLATNPELVRGLSADHPALRDAHTIFPGTVVDATASPRLLVSGINQRKLGSHVTKGAWAGMPIFALTLEERATCPSSCHHWGTCYGNNMHMARRHRHGPELEFLLDRELASKQAEHPAGFVVRLHILGDFVDAAYVALWGRWLAKYASLRVFGFTARAETSDEGILIQRLNRDFSARWAVRFSGTEARGVPGVRYAITTNEMPSGPTLAGAVVCPAQTGKTAACGTCGFCWSGTKDVAFILHGRTHAAHDEDDDTAGVPISLPTAAPAPASTGRGVAKLVSTPGARNSRLTPWSLVGTAPVAGGVHTVALRAIEIRAWLLGYGVASDGLSPAEMLLAANQRRELSALAHFRLIPERSGARYVETIVPAHA